MSEVDDRTLAKTLIRAGALTPDQFRECAAATRDLHSSVTIIDVALQRGYVDEGEVEVTRAQLAADLAHTWALRRDAAVAKFVIQRQFVTREEVEDCRGEQLVRLKRGEDVTLLQVLLDRGCLSQRQAEIVSGAVNDRGHRRLGDFEVVRKLGEGGMGMVYKARQMSTGRTVALKVLPRYLVKEPTVLKRFYREAQVCARLRHPNIVQGLAVGEAEGRHYFAMEFVDGRSLKEIVEQDGPMSPKDALPIFIGVTTGLAYAHALDLIHRDIKPENVILTLEGVPKLADLGLAKDTRFNRSAITQSGLTLGTAYYMPPEQAKNAKRVDKRSDIYSLGATFYHVLTGRVPYQGDSAFEVLSKHESALLISPREVNPNVPEALSAIIQRMMQKQPEDRYGSADEVLEALRRVDVSAPAGQPRGEGPEPAPAPPLAPTTAHGDELWYAWVAGPNGEPVVRQFDLAALEEAIETHHLPLDVPIRRGTKEPFKPMERHPPLRRALRVRRAKDRAIRRQRRRRQKGKAPSLEPDEILARYLRHRRVRAAAKWGALAGLIIVVAWILVVLIF